MQKETTMRMLSAADLVGSASLIVVPLIAGVAPNSAFPGAIGLILSGASLVLPSTALFAFAASVVSFMLFASFAGWAFTFWGTFSSISDTASAGLAALCALVAIAFLLLMLLSLRQAKDGK
jgi:ABC-type Mn2+/Zn2+ transport system permease subunit